MKDGKAYTRPYLPSVPENHLPFLIFQWSLRKIEKNLPPTLAENDPILRVLHKNFVSFKQDS